MMKRMSFQSPVRKEEASSSKNFSLLNYMLFKEKELKIGGGTEHRSHQHTKMGRDQFTVLEVLGKGGFGKVMKV